MFDNNWFKTCLLNYNDAFKKLKVFYLHYIKNKFDLIYLHATEILINWVHNDKNNIQNF